MSFSPIGEGFSVGSIMKNLLANAGNTGSIPGSGRSPGEGNGNSLQWSCWDDPMDRGAWWATVYRMAKELDTTKQLNHSKEHILHLKQHCSLMNKCVLDKFETDVLDVLHHHFNVFSTFKCSFLLWRHWILILYSLWELSSQESFPVWKHESAEFLTYAENFLSFFLSFFKKNCQG